MVAVPLSLDAGLVTKLVGAVTEVEGIGPSGVSGYLVTIGNVLDKVRIVDLLLSRCRFCSVM